MAASAPAQPAGRPRLSVVIPVLNEEQWIARSVEAVVHSARTAGWPVEIVVVDDGSTDGTPDTLRRLAAEHGVVVVTQPNAGRFRARRAGIERATGEWILLLDSRVIVREPALGLLGEQLRTRPDRRVWNGHVHVVTRGNPYSGFWAGLVKVAWRRYTANPRLTSFGIEDFDAYPKGAGFFCAPRDLLVTAADAFQSLYADDRMSSDDTKLIRWVAERERIWLSPDLACDYFGRSSLTGFARHAYFRGGTFVDGYLGAAGSTRRAAALAVVATGGLLALAARRPRTAVAAGLSVPLAAAVTARRCGASRAEAGSVALLLPVFAPSFGAGAVKGLTLAAVERRRRMRLQA